MCLGPTPFLSPSKWWYPFGVPLETPAKGFKPLTKGLTPQKRGFKLQEKPQNEIWAWLKIKQEGLRRFWSMFPLHRATHFGIPVFWIATAIWALLLVSLQPARRHQLQTPTSPKRGRGHHFRFKALDFVDFGVWPRQLGPAKRNGRHPQFECGSHLGPPDWRG